MAGEVRRLLGLNWGCGPDWADLPGGWVNSDIVDYGQPHVGDIRDGLRFDDEVFGSIVANHSLQALTHDEVGPALVELRRVLAPGGFLRVMVPDVVEAFRAFEQGEEDWPGFVAITEPWSLDRKFAHYLTWGGTNRTCFTRISLAEHLDAAGFRPPAPEQPWLTDLDSRLGESIVATAIR